MEEKLIFADINEDIEVIENYKRPEVIIGIEWLTKNLDKYEPYWRIKAYRLFLLWSIEYGHNSPRIYRKFVSNFIDEFYQEVHDSINMKVNEANINDWAFKLSYTLHIFYYLEDTLKIYENE